MKLNFRKWFYEFVLLVAYIPVCIIEFIIIPFRYLNLKYNPNFNIQITPYRIWKKLWKDRVLFD